MTLGAVRLPVAEPERDPRVGQMLSNKYRLLRRIGQGSMGVVYEAEHLRLRRACAVKLLQPALGESADPLRRFRREAVRAGRVLHEHVVSVTDYDVADGTPYLVMELLRGETLRALSRRTGPLPAARAIDIAAQVASGLSAVHEAGLVHRDLKPQNVFVTRRADGTDLIKLLDFGVAKLVVPDDSLGATAEGSVVGTLRYMAPEQIRNASDVDARADVYALGAIVYELLAGRPAFAATDMHTLIEQALAGQVPELASLRPGLPKALLVAVERAMALAPDARFASAAELAQALKASRGEGDEADTADDRSSPLLVARRGATTAVPGRHNRRRAGAIALVLTIAAVALALLWPHDRAEQPDRRARARLDHRAATSEPRTATAPTLVRAQSAARPEQPAPSQPSATAAAVDRVDGALPQPVRARAELRRTTRMLAPAARRATEPAPRASDQAAARPGLAFERDNPYQE
jgi:serine/threonine-protein kinase